MMIRVPRYWTSWKNQKKQHFAKKRLSGVDNSESVELLLSINWEFSEKMWNKTTWFTLKTQQFNERNMHISCTIERSVHLRFTNQANTAFRAVFSVFMFKYFTCVKFFIVALKKEKLAYQQSCHIFMWMCVYFYAIIVIRFCLAIARSVLYNAI